MPRYIDADKLKEVFDEHEDDYGYLHGYWEEFIDNAPTADVVEVDKAQKEIDYWHDKAQSYEQTILKLSLNKADGVEVVRCKDCKHYKRNVPCVYGHYNGCELSGLMVELEHYCSYGERKEE